MNIKKLIIEDVRCFAGRQEFNIRPLTFLVGENSTGKSTVLGCLGILSTLLDTFTLVRADNLDFNTEPYQMGAFADIVRRSNPRKKKFRLGITFQSDKGGVEYILDCVERERGSEPVILEERFIFENGEIICKKADSLSHFSNGERFSSSRVRYVDSLSSSSRVNITSEKTGVIQKFNVELMPLFSGRDRHTFKLLDYLWFLTMDPGNIRSSKSSSAGAQFHKFLEYSRTVLNQAESPSSTQSFAPIRSKPQRTYDPLKETMSPEGNDVPVLLVNMSKTDNESWQELKHRLVEFGKASGLFADISVRRLGKSIGDPFQLQIKVNGPKVNLIDVGYGINQILPILVRILNESRITTFLMQQPEVHLHPRGQAELSSLLVDLVKQREHKFIVETHSDYMVDRTRIEIMKKRISPEDVSLIYLEPAGNSVKVHNIGFDDQANLLGAPDGYREFFLRESDRLLGLA